MFWVVLISIVGVVSGSIVLAQNDGSITSAIDSAEADAGFGTNLFLGLAQNLYNNLGFEAGANVILGFESLPLWINLMLFIPMIFFTVFMLVVTLVPGVG